MVDIEKAKLDPSAVFHHPMDILNDKTITVPDKIDILRRWAYDEREIEVAEEENMRPQDSKKPHLLDEILHCLLLLGVKSDEDRPPPTKQG